MWADLNIELVWLDSNHFNYLYDKWKDLVNFLFVYLCSCLLTSIRIFTLKKFFLTSSKYFIRTYLKKHIFQLSVNNICITLEYLDDLTQKLIFPICFLLLLASWLPKIFHLVNSQKIPDVFWHHQTCDF